MFCTSCGTKNMADSNFCKQCGHKLVKCLPTKISEADYDCALPEDEQVASMLERAYRLRANGDIGLAIALCEETLRLRPESTSAHSLLAQLYESIGERLRAIEELDIVLARNPASIADRIKRDSLRDGVPGVPHRIVSPRLALIERDDAPIRALAFAGILIAVVAVGWALTLAGRDRSADHAAGQVAANTNTPSTPPVAPAPNYSPAPLPSPIPAPSRTAVRQNAAATSDNGFFQPPISVPVAPTSTSRAARDLVNAPAPPEKRRDEATAKRADPADKVRVDPNTADSGEDNVVIPVGQSANRTPAVKGKAAAPPVTDTHDSAPTVIKITAADETAAGSAGASSSSGQAQSMEAVASDFMKKSDYGHAIAAYRDALRSAGDDTGYIYQQIAVCFQESGDHASALTNYQRAITEFQRLKKAGRLKDRDGDGMRICQRGIQICSE